MKFAITRVTIRPGKSVAVSSEAMARARGALEAFGVTEAHLERLARFKGDVTIGPASKHGVVRLLGSRTAKSSKTSDAHSPAVGRTLGDQLG